MKSIVITGASSGIGRATAKLFAANGWKVAATMRNPQKETELQSIENITVFPLDVTDEESVEKAAESIIKAFGTVDTLLNNAGYALMGPFEKANQEDIKKQFDTNVLGLMNVTRAFLPHFRKNNSGMILNVSSIGGRVGFPFISLYVGTKYAVDGFSESLSYELSQFGIQVKIIEPGGVATDFAGRSMSVGSRDDITAYDENFRKYLNSMGSGALLGSSTPEFLAEGIYAAATDGKEQLRYLIGPDAEKLYARLSEVGDDAYIASIKSQFLGR